MPAAIDPPRDDASMFDGWGQTDPVVVEEGSRVLAELPEFQCTAWMPQAVLEVTGDPQEVLRRYIDQLERITHPEPPEIREALDVDGGKLTVGFVAELGGLSYSVHLFESDDHGDWLRLESCYD